MPRLLPEESPSEEVAREVARAAEEKSVTPTPTVRDLIREMDLGAPEKLRMGSIPAVVAGEPGKSEPAPPAPPAQPEISSPPAPAPGPEPSSPPPSPPAPASRPAPPPLTLTVPARPAEDLHWTRLWAELERSQEQMARLAAGLIQTLPDRLNHLEEALIGNLPRLVEAVTRLGSLPGTVEKLLGDTLPRLVEGLIGDGQEKILARLDEQRELLGDSLPRRVEELIEDSQRLLLIKLEEQAGMIRALEEKLASLSAPVPSASAVEASPGVPAFGGGTSTVSATPVVPGEPPRRKRGRPPGSGKKQRLLLQQSQAAPSPTPAAQPPAAEEGPGPAPESVPAPPPTIPSPSGLRVEDVPGLPEKIPEFIRRCIAAGFLTGSEAAYGLAEQLKGAGFAVAPETIYNYLWEEGLMDEKGMLKG